MSDIDDIFLSQEDQDWIKNNTKETKMDNTYNKVQYSEFTPDRVGQWVLRGDTIKEVLDMREELFGKAVTAKPIVQAPAPTLPVAHPNQDGAGSSCKECGSPAQWKEGFSKSTGKPWKGWFCTANREHKPFFIK